jgi:hypothetical protein
MSGEPMRLLDDASVRDEIRQRLAREAGVTPQYDVERGLARLRAAIANEAAGTNAGQVSEPPSSPLSVTGYAVKGSVWKVAGVVGLAGTAAVVGLQAWGPARHVSRVEPLTDPPARAPAAGPNERAPSIEAVFARAEADNLAQIKGALASDPSAALSFVAEGNRRFQFGALREERDASEVQALSALGRRAEAQGRAREFLTTYPKSPLSERVRLSAKL